MGPIDADTAIRRLAAKQGATSADHRFGSGFAPTRLSVSVSGLSNRSMVAIRVSSENGFGR
jgi:hypothetical protein